MGGREQRLERCTGSEGTWSTDGMSPCFPVRPLGRWQDYTGSPENNLGKDFYDSVLDPKQQKPNESEVARTVDAYQ